MSSWDERFVHCTLKSVLKRKVCLCVWMGGGGEEEEEGILSQQR